MGSGLGDGVVFFEDDLCRLVLVGGESGMVVCLPICEVRAVVVFVHGIAEHSARHYGTAKGLAKEGVATVLFDLYGHGFGALEGEGIDPVRVAYAEHDDPRILAEVLRECDIEGGDRYREQRMRERAELGRVRPGDHLRRVESAVAYARGLFDSSLPLFLVGFSLGGLLSAAVGLGLSEVSQSELEGVILVNPALGPRGRPDSWEDRVVRRVWRNRGRFSLLGFVVRQGMRLPLSPGLGRVSKWLSDLPEEQTVQEADPLIHRRFPTRYLRGLESVMIRVREEAAKKGCLKTLLIVSGGDRIVDADEAIQFADDVVGRGSGKVERVVYGGFFPHDILHSSRRGEVLKGMVDWMGLSA